MRGRAPLLLVAPLLASCASTPAADRIAYPDPITQRCALSASLHLETGVVRAGSQTLPVPLSIGPGMVVVPIPTGMRARRLSYGRREQEDFLEALREVLADHGVFSAVEVPADGDAGVAADVRLSVNFLETVYHDRPGHGLTLTVLLSVARGSGAPYARRYRVTSDDASARGKLYQSLGDSKAHVSNQLLAGIVRDVEAWIARTPECHEDHAGGMGE